jgi:hypothetical protein
MSGPIELPSRVYLAIHLEFMGITILGLNGVDEHAA